MSTYPPKLDKARKEWLAGLKDGDEVAVIHADGEPRIIEIRRYDKDRISEHIAGRNYYRARTFTAASGKCPKDKYGGEDCYLVPVTEEIRKRVRLMAWRGQLRSMRWENLADAQIEAVAKALGWEEPNA